MAKWYIREWFDKEAEQDPTSTELHKLSAWSYLSKREFSEIVLDGVAQMRPPIAPGASVYELGTGVGAALDVIAQARRVEAAGCDTSATAVQRAIEHFSRRSQAVPRFAVADMASGELPPGVTDSSYDHVVSFGALAMYLEADDMARAMRVAARIARPGGSVCFTHFIEPHDEPRGTIVHPIEQAALGGLAAEAGLLDVRFHPMRHQGARFMMTGRARAAEDNERPLSTRPNEPAIGRIQRGARLNASAASSGRCVRPAGSCGRGLK